MARHRWSDRDARRSALGFNPSEAMWARVDRVKRTDAYRQARAEVIERVLDVALQGTDALREAGGFSKLIEKAIEEAARDAQTEDWGFFGKNVNSLREALLRGKEEIRSDVQTRAQRR